MEGGDISVGNKFELQDRFKIFGVKGKVENLVSWVVFWFVKRERKGPNTRFQTKSPLDNPGH